MAPTTDYEILVFAYGSNMLSSRIQERCPHARAVGVAGLPGHELAWHKRSKDGSGKCDVVTGDADATVFGVVYAVPRQEKGRLDQAEGLGHGYAESRTTVLLNGVAQDVVMYRATDVDPKLRPYTWYHAIVVAGAREHGLSPDYIDRLQATDAKEDPDRERHARNMALVQGVTKL